MTLNIALNTIIIIMVFLFPGIIARKSFFSGAFKNRYEHGNVVDKFVWNILVSIICLFFFSLAISILKDLYQIAIRNNIFEDLGLNGYSLKYHNIYCVFEALSKNELPSELQDYSTFFHYFIYLLFLYTFCFLAGKFIHKIVKKYRLERILSFLQFSNHWEYLSSPNVYNFGSINPKKKYITWIDVLIGEKEKNELFRGRLEKIIYDKDNKIEHILLNDTIQFVRLQLNETDEVKECLCSEHKNPQNNNTPQDSNNERARCISINGRIINSNSIHIQTDKKIIYKKVIDGNIFVIPGTNIKNLNFTYIEAESKKIKADSIVASTQSKSTDSGTSIVKIFLWSIIFISISIIWYFIRDYIKETIILNSTLLTIIRRVVKGVYIIFIFILYITSVPSLFDKKYRITSTTRSSLVSILILFTIPLFTIVYNLDLIFTLAIMSLYMLILELASNVIVAKYHKRYIADRICLAIGIIYVFIVYCFLIH